MKFTALHDINIRRLCATVPVCFSLLAIVIVLGHAAIYGTVHEPDEGAAAHIFQLLMAAQIPFIAALLLKSEPETINRSWSVLVLLAGLWLIAGAAVYWLT